MNIGFDAPLQNPPACATAVSGNAGVNIAAGSNLILRAARVASTAGSTNLAAKNVISVETVDESHTSTFHKEERSSGLFSKTSKTIDDNSSQTYARGSCSNPSNLNRYCFSIEDKVIVQAVNSMSHVIAK